MAHVRKGDLVVVISGADKGKRGKILRVVGNRVVVEKVAMIKRHTRATQQNPQGGIVDKEGSIHISNVRCSTTKTNRGTRTKNVADGDQKVRVGVKSGTKFPTRRDGLRAMANEDQWRRTTTRQPLTPAEEERAEEGAAAKGEWQEEGRRADRSRAEVQAREGRRRSRRCTTTRSARADEGVQLHAPSCRSRAS